MPFIGIIAKENDYNFIKKEINKNYKTDELNVIFINGNSIENLKNIKFDILIVNERIDELLNNSKYLEKIISSSYYIIINSDIENDLTFLNANANQSVIITYGFNKNAIVTISSITEDKIMVCIQNAINNKKDILIEEQEISIKICKNDTKKTYNILAICMVLRIYGKILKKI